MRPRVEPIPLYTIDLSLPPSERHNDICQAFDAELSIFRYLYQAIINMSGFPIIAGAAARLLLRRVHSKEETEEIKGIARATRMKLNEVVAYNTFLDLFSGCVSGGVKAKAAEGGAETVLHFRGLDWEMDLLRDLLVQVQYKRDGKIVARAVTYAGYVGTLTGVREGLSMSMNYRLRLNSSSNVLAHRKHQLSILLGLRPSIASQLRTLLLSPGPAPSLSDVQAHFESAPASPCYLTFCSPDEVLIMEKDLKGLASEARISDTFLAITNHDRAAEDWSKEKWVKVLKKQGIVGEQSGLTDMIMENSMHRKRCITELWEGRTECAGPDLEESSNGQGTVRGARVGVEEIKEWLRTYPLRNATTHFSCIMDPAREGGGILWAEACEEVPGSDSELSHDGNSENVEVSPTT
ncbi:beta subunit of N-acylethanolamine-hydrolyzing acid amidase-domain-containing protein [Ephemerocybe angulata]|uniref:ceramidase n=1 Tax=Ephemerocybe angulata TaxID=980116 RepID=A0A8H6I6A8_9AGAR|nr:beta subunit of N-acylethanolamine-hydrolyzing acid amidase-domain-containing protein [Tulosesus angulatus]